MKKRIASLVIISSAVMWWFTLPPKDSAVVTPAQATQAPESPPELHAPPKSLEQKIEMPSLITLQDLGRLTEDEVHQTPETLIQSMQVILELVAAAEVHRSKRSPTLELLLKCASDERYPAALRALCYREGVRGIQRWDLAINLSDYQVPTDIQLLSEKVD